MGTNWDRIFWLQGWNNLLIQLEVKHIHACTELGLAHPQLVLFLKDREKTM